MTQRIEGNWESNGCRGFFYLLNVILDVGNVLLLIIILMPLCKLLSHLITLIVDELLDELCY